MTSKSKYADRRKQWWEQTLGEDLTEARLVMPKEDHAKIVAMAKQLGERIPIVLGQFVVSHLASIEGRDPPAPLRSKLPAVDIAKIDMPTLSRLILKSRFAGDTGAARYRQIAFVNSVAVELSLGHRPTFRSLALSVDAYPSQMEVLGKALESRGVVQRIHLSGLNRSRAGKVLFICEDAIEALNRAHIEQVGTPLLPLAEEQSDE